MAMAMRQSREHLNGTLAEIDNHTARDKAGVAIWKAREDKEPTRDLIKDFEQKYGIKFNDWEKEAGLLSATGMKSLRAEDIIKEIEAKQ